MTLFLCQRSKFSVKIGNLKSLVGDYSNEMKKLITLTRVNLLKIWSLRNKRLDTTILIIVKSTKIYENYIL